MKTTLAIVLIAAVCAVFGVWITQRQVVLPLTFSTSQLCTNQVLVCKVDNAHSGIVALGFNRKVRVVASDLKKVGFITVQIVNCLSKDVNLGLDVNAAHYDRPLPDENDRVLFEVALAGQSDAAKLVTGNLKHFPSAPFVVTPAHFCEIIGV